ncbi:MAG TPA: tRNA (guanosine(37)-N1)-methyltransferase TrmD [Elusimicrobiota bacterium]|nr:tRNA (guanosine(37)-N1)-methyltransferase TrmD [Elusimicrobiota bacterium]
MKRQPLTIDILTLFPKMFQGVFTESLIGKAQEKGLVRIQVHDIRTQATDRHRTADDRPFGGGPGMVLKPDPVFRTFRTLGIPADPKRKRRSTVVYLSPQGRRLDQKLVEFLSARKHLVLLCGHYEGVDERLMDWVDLEVSVGDAVLTGGEIPAMALTDAVVRWRPGVVQDQDSLKWDSFAEGWSGLLDCPHYTRPQVWRDRKVPEVLLEGNHARIAQWRREMSMERTRRKRPDLLRAEKKKSEIK